MRVSRPGFHRPRGLRRHKCLKPRKSKVTWPSLEPIVEKRGNSILVGAGERRGQRVIRSRVVTPLKPVATAVCALEMPRF